MTTEFDSSTTTIPAAETPSLTQKACVSGMCFVAFLLLYLIMSGPLVWMEGKMKFGPFSKSVKTMYAPLAQVVKSDVKPASSVIKAYISLFKK